MKPSRTSLSLAITATLALASSSVAAEISWRSGAAVDVRPAASNLSQSAAERHVLVRLSRIPNPEARKSLASAGLHLHAYVQDNSYFATIEPGFSADSSADGGIIAGIFEIETTWKLHPVLAAGQTPEWAVISPGPDAIIGAYVLLHPDVDLDKDGDGVVAAHFGVVRDRVRSVNALVIEAALSDIITLASEDGVQWIEPALPRLRELNSENRALTGANTVQAAPYSLNGAGVSVLVYDGGSGRATHVDFGGRLSVHDGSTLSTHSTHVAATIGGSGAASGGANRGMAPGVALLSYGFEYDGSGTFLYTNPGDIEDDYTAAIGLGADISNNSIGTNVEPNGFACSIQGDYGVTDATIDAIVRGSLGSPFRVVWAAGNERGSSRCDVEGFGDYYSSAPPGGAKNHLCIGAVNANDDSMTSFSSWGPTDDGRLKPDFVAPGCQSGGDNGVTSATGLSDNGYTVACGTSMASPTACGLAALLLQDYRAHFAGPDPRNSTLKVLFAHNAFDLGNAGPDYQFGYGSIRIQETIDFMRSGRFVEDSAGHGETVRYTMTVAPGTTELKLTLAWDDQPGTPNVNPALVNDLDLRVLDPSLNQHFPWTLNPASPSSLALRTQADHRNNLEQVYVESPEAGEWTIEIVGTAVPAGPQPFSIATSAAPVLQGLRIRLPSGAPSLMTPGVGASFLVEITGASLVPGSPTLRFRYDDGPFLNRPLTPTGAATYQADLPPPVCAATPEFYVSAESTVTGLVLNPSAAPAAALVAEVGVDIISYSDAVESDLGWVVGAAGDSATTGIWVRADPVGTEAQPEDDHSPAGTMCWVTGQGTPGGSVGTADVDGGRTSLTSPAIDATGLTDPLLSYWRWYSNSAGAAPNADVFTVQISNNNGANWSTLEIVGPTGSATIGGWRFAEFRIADTLPPTNQMKLRFIAEDAASGSIIEAAVDDLQVRGRECTAALVDCNANGIVDADDIASGRSGDLNGNDVPDECDPPPACPGNVNNDGVVDLTDLSLLLSAFGTSSGDPAYTVGADFDLSGSINLTDLSILLSVFGTDCP